MVVCCRCCLCAVCPGIDNGARLRVKGEGNAGRRGAPPGDLIVYIRVKDHPELRRDGIDIHSDIDISYVDAILGSQVRRHAVPCCLGRVCWVGMAGSHQENCAALVAGAILFQQEFCRAHARGCLHWHIPRLIFWCCLLLNTAGQGDHSGWSSGVEDPCRHAARHNAAHGKARRATPGSKQPSARQPQCK